MNIKKNTNHKLSSSFSHRRVQNFNSVDPTFKVFNIEFFVLLKIIGSDLSSVAILIHKLCFALKVFSSDQPNTTTVHPSMLSAKDIWGTIVCVWKLLHDLKIFTSCYVNILTNFFVDWHWILTSAVKIARTGLWSDSLHSPRLYCLCFIPFPNHIILSHLHN